MAVGVNRFFFIHLFQFYQVRNLLLKQHFALQRIILSFLFNYSRFFLYFFCEWRLIDGEVFLFGLLICWFLLFKSILLIVETAYPLFLLNGRFWFVLIFGLHGGHWFVFVFVDIGVELILPEGRVDEVFLLGFTFEEMNVVGKTALLSLLGLNLPFLHF